MTGVMEKQDTIQSDFEALKQRTAKGPGWLQSLRDRAMNRFLELGWPTAKDENWRFTNIKPISRGAFRIPPTNQIQAQKQEIDHALLREMLIDDRIYLVFVNGVFAPDLSKLTELPDSVRLQSLSQALENEPQSVRDLLDERELETGDAFSALNTAFLEQGVLLHVPREFVLKAPIQFIHLAIGEPEPVAIHTRDLIVLDMGAEATLVESFYSLGIGASWTNGVTHARLGKNARLTRYFRELQNENAHHVASIEIQQDRDSRFEGHNLLLGGSLVRNNIRPVLDGPGAEADINTLFVGHGAQHQDSDIFVDHAKPHCRSRQFVKGILDDQAKGVFTGRVMVRPDAQKTDAHQINRNLLLSDEARIDAKPQLEIYADDVKCAHGATTGQIDEDALFYLKTRGLDPDSAFDLLLFAFAHEVIEPMPLENIRRQAESFLFQRFTRARMIGDEA